MRQPVIFIGMHRSGTSMIGRLLENLGLFAGTRKDENNEAIFFRQINHWLLSQSGARWDTPQALQYLSHNEPLLTLQDGYIRQLLDGPRAVLFLGLRRYLVSGGITRLTIPWGWKDPRNTFTLPMWLRLFPGARVVYIERHGVDVAQSLRVRSEKIRVYANRKYKKYRKMISVHPKQGGFTDSPRCISLEGGFSLWQEYMQQAAQVMQQLPGERVLKLRYEQVLEAPVQHLQTSADFCGLNVANQQLQALVTGVNADRAYSYQNNPELKEFARQHRSALAERNY